MWLEQEEPLWGRAGDLAGQGEGGLEFLLKEGKSLEVLRPCRLFLQRRTLWQVDEACRQEA